MMDSNEALTFSYNHFKQLLSLLVLIRAYGFHPFVASVVDLLVQIKQAGCNNFFFRLESHCLMKKDQK